MPATTENYPQLRKQFKEPAAKLISAHYNSALGTKDIVRYWDKVLDKLMVQVLTLMDTFSSVDNESAQKYVTDPKAGNEQFYGKWRVVELRTSKRYEPEGLVQVLRKVEVIDAVADLAGMSPLIKQGNEILDLFGLEQGEGDFLAFTFPHLDPESRGVCMNIPDADLVSSLANSDQSSWATGAAYTIGSVRIEDSTTYVCVEAHTGGTFADDLAAGKWVAFGTWNYAKRVFNVEADNTASFYVLFRKVAWNAWADNAGSPDLKNYDNAGTDNERERLTKIWQNIQQADLATARDACRAGSGDVAAESGYVITNVYIADNHNGSITVQQVQKKQVNNKDVGTSDIPGERAINPLGWDGGKHEFIDTHYEHFTAAGLASALASESAPSGYTRLMKSFSLDGDGLYSGVYRYLKATFTNVTGDPDEKTLANFRVFAHENYDPKNDSAGIHRRKMDGGDGVPIDDLAEVRDNQEPDSGWIMDGVTGRDNQDGSGSVRRRQTKLRSKTDQIRRQWRAGNGNRSEAETVVWYDLSETDAGLVYDDAYDNSTDMTGATYAEAPESHVLLTCDRMPAGNGSYTVVRVTWVPKTGGSSEVWDNFTDESITWTETKYRRPLIDGEYVDQKRVWAYKLYVKQTMSRTDAYDYAGGKGGTKTPCSKPQVQVFSGSRYRASFIECTDEGAWDDEA